MRIEITKTINKMDYIVKRIDWHFKVAIILTYKTRLYKTEASVVAALAGDPRTLRPQVPPPALPPPSLLLHYPGPGALLGAAVGLLHIQSHYNLSIPSLLQGRLVPGGGQVTPGGRQVTPGDGKLSPAGGQLESGDVRLVARGAAQLGRLDLELAWLQHLLGAGREVEQEVEQRRCGHSSPWPVLTPPAGGRARRCAPCGAASGWTRRPT